MTYNNNQQLHEFLAASDGADYLLVKDCFELDDAEFSKHSIALTQNHCPTSEISDRAAYRCLSPLFKQNTRVSSNLLQSVAQTVTVTQDQTANFDKLGLLLKKLLIPIIVLLAILTVLSATGHAQNINPAVVVNTCGLASALSVGDRAYLTVDTNNQLCANVAVSVSATFTTSGLASALNQTNSSQKTQVCDSGGNCATITAGKLDVGATVTASVNTTGLATSIPEVSQGGALTKGIALIGQRDDNSLGRFLQVDSGGILYVADDQLNSTLGTVVTNTNTFVTSGGGGYIRQDSTGTIAKETGGNLATVAGIVTSSRAAVNPIVGQSGIASGTGTDGATVPRVTLATNVALPAGTNVLGHVIVDTTSTTAVTQATGTNLHAVIDSGTIAVSGVTGTVTINTSGLAIEAGNLATLAGAITSSRMASNPIVGQAGIAAGTGVDGATVPRVSLATNVALPAGTNVIGHIICDSGCSSSTAPADNSAFTAGTTSSSPMSGFYHATRDTLTDGRIGAVALNANRAMLTQLEDASKNAIGSTGNALDVNIKSSATLTVTDGAGALNVIVDSGTTVVTQTTASNLNMTEASAAASKTDLDTIVTNTTNIATAARQDTGNTSLASIVTNTNGLAVSTGGGYVRQDSMATIARETGGNLDAVSRALTLIASDLHSSVLPTAKAGLSIRTGLFNRPVDAQNPLPVIVQSVQDPCSGPKGNVAISQAASSTIITGIPGKRIAVCGGRVVAGAAEILSFLEGTGTLCATGTLAVTGNTTMANGESYAANGGFSQGGANASIMVTALPGNNLCLGQSTTSRLSGNLTYVYTQ